MRNGRPAVKDSIGWYCNCCNFRIRRNPRNAEYKQRLRHSARDRGSGAAASATAAAAGTPAGGDRAPKSAHPAAAAGSGRSGSLSTAEIDLTYFNKRRARMLRDLGRALAGHKGPGRPQVPGQLAGALEYEFGAEIDALVSLALSGSPNKVSLIADFERAKAHLGSVPTRQDMKRGPPLGFRCLHTTKSSSRGGTCWTGLGTIRGTGTEAAGAPPPCTMYDNLAAAAPWTTSPLRASAFGRLLAGARLDGHRHECMILYDKSRGAAAGATLLHKARSYACACPYHRRQRQSFATR